MADITAADLALAQIAAIVERERELWEREGERLARLERLLAGVEVAPVRRSPAALPSTCFVLGCREPIVRTPKGMPAAYRHRKLDRVSACAGHGRALRGV